MARLDFTPDFEFNMVRVAWVALFVLLLHWGHTLKRAETPVAELAPKATIAR